METESLDDQEVANLATNASNVQNFSNFTAGHNTGKGRKHFFFQVIYF